MLGTGKGRGVGRIAASVVRWARAVPLGIKHDVRRVGGLCAPNRTSALLQQWKQTRVVLGAFLAVLDGRKTRRAEKIFFVKKMGIWQIWPLDGPKSGPFFFTWYQNLPPGKVTGNGSETRALRIFTTCRPSEVQIW